MEKKAESVTAERLVLGAGGWWLEGTKKMRDNVSSGSHAKICSR